MDRDGALEVFGVTGDGTRGPLAGGDEFAEAGDDASRVVGVVDATDNGAVAAVEEVAKKVLSPHDSDAFGGVFRALSFVDCGGQERDAIRRDVGMHQAIGVAFVETHIGGFGGVGGFILGLALVLALGLAGRTGLVSHRGLHKEV